jgi:hypothetical protein
MRTAIGQANPKAAMNRIKNRVASASGRGPLLPHDAAVRSFYLPTNRIRVPLKTLSAAQRIRRRATPFAFSTYKSMARASSPRRRELNGQQE